jgi:hypothetical protein
MRAAGRPHGPPRRPGGGRLGEGIGQAFQGPGGCHGTRPFISIPHGCLESSLLKFYSQTIVSYVHCVNVRRDHQLLMGLSTGHNCTGFRYRLYPAREFAYSSPELALEFAPPIHSVYTSRQGLEPSILAWE